jgi:hypothetical protein
MASSASWKSSGLGSASATSAAETHAGDGQDEPFARAAGSAAALAGEADRGELDRFHRVAPVRFEFRIGGRG